MSLRNPNSAYPNEIAAFIAAFFIARPFGRVPLDRMLVKLEVSRDAELFQPARVAQTWVYRTYDTKDSASRITHHGPGTPAPVSITGLALRPDQQPWIKGHGS